MPEFIDRAKRRLGLDDILDRAHERLAADANRYDGTELDPTGELGSDDLLTEFVKDRIAQESARGW